jgi:hypothetical protein
VVLQSDLSPNNPRYAVQITTAGINVLAKSERDAIDALHTLKRVMSVDTNGTSIHGVPWTYHANHALSSSRLHASEKAMGGAEMVPHDPPDPFPALAFSDHLRTGSYL